MPEKAPSYRIFCVCDACMRVHGYVYQRVWVCARRGSEGKSKRLQCWGHVITVAAKRNLRVSGSERTQRGTEEEKEKDRERRRKE